MPTTIYQSKNEVRCCAQDLEDHRMVVVLSNEPAVIDTIVCQTDTIPERELRVFHGDNGTWTTDQEWSKDHPETASKEKPCGYMCDNCHEPVMYYSSKKNSGEIRHVRLLCGCTMLMMNPQTVDWWSEINGKDGWNNIIVAGAKQGHRQHGIK